MEVLKRARREGKRYLNPVPTPILGGWAGLKIAGRFLRNRRMRRPARAPGPFRTDAGVYTRPPASGLRVTWMGHSAMLLELDGLRVLIDPVWNEWAGPARWMGSRRFFQAPLPLAQLPRIDVVLISHDHYDHLGAGTVRQLAKLAALREARWVTTLGVGVLLQKLGVPAAAISELDWTESLTLAGLKLTALPARHFSGRSPFNRFHTLWACFVLATPTHRVFYGADSGEWEGFATIAREYGPFDLSMLEIGAFDQLWAANHLGPAGALRTFEQMGGTGLLMPIHWGLFDLGLHAWRQPIEELFALAGPVLWSPEPGLPGEVTAGRELRSEWWRELG